MSFIILLADINLEEENPIKVAGVSADVKHGNAAIARSKQYYVYFMVLEVALVESSNFCSCLWPMLWHFLSTASPAFAHKSWDPSIAERQCLK